MSRFAFALLLAFAATGCQSAPSPKLTFLGVREAPRHEVVFLQVTNPASRPMRLTKLEYTFASQGTQIASGEVLLARDLAAGAAAVVEVPLEAGTTGPVVLNGTLIAELDQIVRTFTVSAQVGPR
jgi:LEA14-like dessication related protein